MEQYLMDTNAVSDYFSASFSDVALAFMDKAIDDIPNISIITQIELLCWNTDEIITQNVKSFIADSIVLDITPSVIVECVGLRKGKKTKTPDAIIAATALAYGFSLITNNEKDFAHIKGLKIINPTKL
ncbi:MAG: type II toxin-antitoxin system VapC family toxin [Ginsengibacter sp.]